MCRIGQLRSAVCAISLALPMASASDDTVFHTWIEAPAQVLAGETFTISVWTSLSGSLLDQGDVAFAGFGIDLHATGNGVAQFSPAHIPNLVTASIGIPVKNGRLDVRGFQFFFGGLVVLDNPILLFTTEVVTVDGYFGELIITPHARHGSEFLTSWYRDIPDSVAIADDDPDSTRIIIPATIRVIPSPGVLAMLGLTALAASHRRR